MIKSARVMKKAVAVLIPYMEKEKQALLPEGERHSLSVRSAVMTSACYLQYYIEGMLS